MRMVKSYFHPEEDGLDSPSRRDFLKKCAYVVGGTTVGGILSISGCKNNTTIPDIPEQPATEEEGRDAMKDGITSKLNQKGYRFEISEDKKVYTDREGKFDIFASVDTNGDEKYDFGLAGNYVTDGESLQGLSDEDRLKTLEISKGTSPLTDYNYIKGKTEEWVENHL